jgi:hypothetical protein
LALSPISVVGSLSGAIVQGVAAMPSWLIARDSRDKSGLPQRTLSGFFATDYDTTADADAGL